VKAVTDFGDVNDAKRLLELDAGFVFAGTGRIGRVVVIVHETLEVAILDDSGLFILILSLWLRLLFVMRSIFVAD